MYIIGELENHENLRRLIADLKIELKALEVKINEKLRAKFVHKISIFKNPIFFLFIIRLHK
jgi:hypothetical protein